MSAEATLEKDPSGYYLKWCVVVDGRMLRRYSTKRQASRHVAMYNGDLSAAPAWYREELAKALKSLRGRGQALKSAGMSARLLGLSPCQVNADPNTGEPL